MKRIVPIAVASLALIALMFAVCTRGVVAVPPAKWIQTFTLPVPNSAAPVFETINQGLLTDPLPVANGGTGASTLTGAVVGNGTSAMTAGTLSVANGGTGSAGAQTDSTGSTAGHAYSSQVISGGATVWKKFAVQLAGFNDAGTTLTYPTAFTNTPGVVANTTSLSPTVGATTIAIGATSGAKSGIIVLEGY